MTEVSPKRNYILGHRIMLVSAAIFALARALYFIPSSSRPELPDAIQLLTAIIPIWLWVGAWLTVTFLCLYDLLRGRGRLGVGSLVGMMFAWGTAYLVNYIITVITVGWGSSEWSNVALFYGAGGVILGLNFICGSLKAEGDRV